ncbi:hypothetical protein BCO37747_00578 [Burkholderia contaminans]|jgi:hypothetical protein|nr:hypothetical protein SK875_B02161 [Burkholderia contaminans]VWB37536.1 hypothetical protein BCO23253_01663 [Burkholderia contaminans]VWC71631.1 hypothetical protein BCO37747_00578 [Burkholderia contaminans]
MNPTRVAVAPFRAIIGTPPLTAQAPEGRR